MSSLKPLRKPKRGLIGPQADPDFTAIASASIRWRVRLAHVIHHIQRSLQRFIGQPVSALMLTLWSRR